MSLECSFRKDDMLFLVRSGSFSHPVRFHIVFTRTPAGFEFIAEQPLKFTRQVTPFRKLEFKGYKIKQNRKILKLGSSFFLCPQWQHCQQFCQNWRQIHFCCSLSFSYFWLWILIFSQKMQIFVRFFPSNFVYKSVGTVPKISVIQRSKHKIHQLF